MVPALTYAAESSAATALRRLDADPDVRHVFYNQTFSLPTVSPAPSLTEVARSRTTGTGAAGSRTQAGTTPADGRRIAAGGTSLRGYQWYLDRIGDDLVRPPRKDAPVVAVIDTGVDATHHDLAGQVVRCPVIPGLYCDVVDHDQVPMDTVGHGTHVASTIAAGADGSGIRGVSPTSTVLPVRIFDDRGRTDLMTIFQALDYVVQAKVRIPNLRVANMSFGGVLVKGSAEHRELNSRLAALRDAGVLAVAAAGNDSDLYLQAVPLVEGIEVVDMPAMGPGVLAVAATDQTDYRTYFSNYSTAIRINSCATYYEEDGYRQCAADNAYTTRTLRHVPVAAPGWQVLAAMLRGQHVEMAGTSMASPIVAGAAARVMSVYPRLTNPKVRQRIIRTGAPLGAEKGFPFATRRLDLRRALDVRATGFTGRVMDGVDGTPIAGATVTLSSGGRVVDTARTDASGFYTLRGATAGTSYTLAASRRDGPAYISNSRRAVAADGELRDPGDLSLAPLRTDGSYTFMAEWRNVATGIEEYRKESFIDFQADRPYPWPAGAAGMPLANIDPIFGVPYPGELADSVEFDRHNPGSLSGLPYGRHTSDGYVDLDPPRGHRHRQAPRDGQPALRRAVDRAGRIREVGGCRVPLQERQVVAPLGVSQGGCAGGRHARHGHERPDPRHVGAVRHQQPGGGPVPGGEPQRPAQRVRRLDPPQQRPAGGEGTGSGRLHLREARQHVGDDGTLLRLVRRRLR